MSQIHVAQNFSIPRDEVRTAVDILAMKLRERFGAQTAWKDDVLNFSGSGVDGAISILEDRVTVDADLGLIYGLMKSPIESEIRRVLSEQLS